MASYSENTIPVVVGVTGHREIHGNDIPAIRKAVKDSLIKIRELCPASPLIMLNSLAEGADLLCADVAEELDIPVAAVLPRSMEDYEKDFSPDGADRFRHHCEKAMQVFVAPYTEAAPAEGDLRSFQFRQAGIYVVSHSHILIALWDGGPGTKEACGTADAVGFALKGNYFPASGLSLRSQKNESVIHIVTPRKGREGETAGSIHVLGSWDAAADMIRETDDFNKRSPECGFEGPSRLPQDVSEDPVLVKMDKLSRIAGYISMKNAGKYRRVLALIAVCCAALTFAFLMYDEAEAFWMIIVCGIMLIAAFACQLYASRSDCHRRYIEYRVLSEALRVQTFLRYAGSRVHVAEQFSWTQQEETAWIMVALCTLTIGDTPETKHDIRSCWVEDQRDYHKNALKKSAHQLSVSTHTVRMAMFFSIALYVLALGFELLCGGLIFSPVIAVSNVEIWRTVLKILLGTISAVTLFIANYYGRLSLPRMLSDHQKMERFYNKMSAQLKVHGQSEELLTILAREEMAENGNWCSYQRDNAPDINL